jgi:hypothetical protein
MKVLYKRVKAPEALKEHSDMLQDYVLSFMVDGKINYGEMGMDLRSFNYDRETNEGILPKSSHSISSGRYSIAGVEPQRDIFNDNYIILDGRKVP